MIEIEFSKSFKRVFKKNLRLNRIDEDNFWEKVEIFLENPYHASLRTHKLSGKLKGLWAFSLEYDLRVVFYFVETDKAVFVDIGTHDEVY